MSISVIRIISGTINFSSMLPEHLIPIVTDDIENLTDIKLSLYGLPTKLPTQDTYCREDYRLYIAGYDVTKALKTVIKDLISQIPEQTIKLQYLAGAKSYVNLLLGAGIIDQPAAGTANLHARQYASSGNWKDKFEILGDRIFKEEHILYPFSFLYRFIQLPLISLTKVWETFISQTATTIPQNFLKITPLVIAFSEGTAPSYQEGYKNSFGPAGRLVYSLELSLKNPLEDKLKAIEEHLLLMDSSLKALGTRLLQIHQVLENVRANYLDSIVNNIAIAREDIRTGNTGLKDGLERLKRTVEQIKGV